MHSEGVWNEPEWASSQCATLVDLRKAFATPLTKPKNLDRGPTAKRELLTEITFFLNALSVWQDKHLITKHLLLLPCELSSSPLKPQDPISFLSSGWHIILNYPIYPWVSLSLWASHTYVIKFVLLLLIHICQFI